MKTEKNLKHIEVYFLPKMAQWSKLCHREVRSGEYLVLTVSKDKVTAVIKREYDNLTKEEIKHAAASASSSKAGGKASSKGGATAASKASSRSAHKHNSIQLTIKDNRR